MNGRSGALSTHYWRQHTGKFQWLFHHCSARSNPWNWPNLVRLIVGAPRPINPLLTFSVRPLQPLMSPPDFDLFSLPAMHHMHLQCRFLPDLRSIQLVGRQVDDPTT